MKNIFYLICTALLMNLAYAAEDCGLVDSLAFGDAQSEQRHALSSDHSETIKGGLGDPARRLLPLDKPEWQGGRLSFEMKVDPEKPNYFTVRLWGDDISQNKLILYCEGKQIGYRHLGDIDLLDHGSDAPLCNGRFFYNTTPLPLEMTRGKTQLKLEIRSTGRIWGYGTNFEQYQKTMTEPTRGIYAAYVHTNGCFVPPATEKQGAAPADPPIRREPGPEMLDAVKKRVNGEVEKLLASKRPLNQMQVHLLARAYHTKSTPAFQNPKAVERVIEACDALYAAYRKDPKLAQSDPATPNPDWFGLGLAADAVRLVAAKLGAALDQPIEGAATRKAAWSEMFQASRDWHRRHRRLYTNQSMIIDLNIYRANRAVASIDPPHALPERDMLRYLYESIGLQPWLGSETDKGPEKPVGENYLQLTAKGLTRELGFVGYYGEVLDWVTQIYDATREPAQRVAPASLPAGTEAGATLLGDAAIKAQLEKIARARAVFRYPALDDEGNRAMRIETVVGWRDVHFPGDVCYGERATWDASTLYTAAATLDADSVGYAQQMLADNQFFALLRNQLKETGLRSTAGMLGIPEQYETIRAQPPSAKKLPMSGSDFVFSDEEDGVVAIKNADEILYASLYWRARYGVNFLARVHHLLPAFSRIAVVREEAVFEKSAQTYTRPDWTNMGFGNGGHRYPMELHSALAGEKLPIAKIPDGIRFKPGDESVFAGKAEFYTLAYGKYLIGMNCSKEKTFDLTVPKDCAKALDLVTRKEMAAGTVLKLAPQTTAVLVPAK
ncbi:MAG TPA: hypothetical protein VGP72_33685 [Planctomycetota bacterium]|jgi:hypothetical protein